MNTDRILPVNREHLLLMQVLCWLGPGIKVFLLFLSSPLHGVHEGIEVGAEGEDVAQGVVVLRVGAVIVSEDKEREAVVVKREHLCQTRQVVHAEAPENDAKLGYLEFLFVERESLQSVKGYIHLLGCGALDVVPARRLVMVVLSVLGTLSAVVTFVRSGRLRVNRDHRQRQNEDA